MFFSKPFMERKKKYFLHAFKEKPGTQIDGRRMLNRKQKLFSVSGASTFLKEILFQAWKGREEGRFNY